MNEDLIGMLGEILSRFKEPDEVLCLGVQDNELFLYGEKDRDPRELMSTIEALLEKDEWLQMVLTGAIMGLMAIDPKFRAKFMALCGMMNEDGGRKGRAS